MTKLRKVFLIIFISLVVLTLMFYAEMVLESSMAQHMLSATTSPSAASATHPPSPSPAPSVITKATPVAPSPSPAVPTLPSRRPLSEEKGRREIVFCRCAAEDLSFLLAPTFLNMSTVYNKGEAWPAESPLVLPRHFHSHNDCFIRHIIDNFESLSEYTTFMATDCGGIKTALKTVLAWDDGDLNFYFSSLEQIEMPMSACVTMDLKMVRNLVGVDRQWVRTDSTLVSAEFQVLVKELTNDSWTLTSAWQSVAPEAVEKVRQLGMDPPDVLCFHSGTMFTTHRDVLRGVALARWQALLPNQYSAMMDFLWYSLLAGLSDVRFSASMLLGPSGRPLNPRKREHEVVVARYSEDVSWTMPYANIVTIYNKGDEVRWGGEQSPVVLVRRNVGRESETYIRHIIENYDNLADFTSFIHGHGTGKGEHIGSHFQFGFTLDDYIACKEPFLMPLSACNSIDLRFYRNRKGVLRHNFADGKISNYPQPETSEDGWNAWVSNNNSGFLGFINWKMHSQGVTGGLAAFWMFVAPESARLVKASLGVDAPPYLCFAQGAQFMLSKATIRSIPLSHWTRIIEESGLGSLQDPAEGYLMEFSWYQVIASGLQLPQTTADLMKDPPE